MQIDTHNDQQVVSAIHNATNIAIFPSKVVGYDAVSASCGLHNMLKALEKKSKILYPGKLPEGLEDIVPQGELISSFSQRELTVSIDFSGQNNAQAHYVTEGETLFVKLSPVSKDFDPQLRVNSKLNVGFGFDLVFIIGANELADLGYVFNELERDITTSTIINISNSSKNTRFGSINIIDPLNDSLSGIVLKKASAWELNVTKEAAIPLLRGISK